MPPRVLVSPQLRCSYLAISAIVRRSRNAASISILRTSSQRQPQRRDLSISPRGRAASNGTYQRSDFSNQGYTGFYEPHETTPGPLRHAHLPPRITPHTLKQHLDAFVVGQERAKRTLATAVYNHYQRIQELQRRDEAEEEALAQEERRRMSDVRRHPVEGRESELKRGIAVPSLTRDWPRPQDEFPGQHPTISVSRSGQATSQTGGTGAGGGHQAPASWAGHGMSGPHTSVPPPPPPPPPPPLQDNTPLTIEKSNILLLGPSGVGKTLMAKTLARVLEVPFSMSDCTPFTQAGYIGEDAEVCVQRLLASANYDVARAERGIICLDEIDKIATARVSHGKDVSGEGVQQALLKIIEGTTLQIQAKQERGSGSGGGSGTGPNNYRQQGYPTNSPLSGGNMSNAGQSSSSSASSGGQKGEVYNVKTDNILFICAGAFNGLHKMVLDRISKGSIGFGATVRAAPGTSSSSSSSSADAHHHETVLEGEDELFEKHLPYYLPPPPPPSSATTHHSNKTNNHQNPNNNEKKQTKNKKARRTFNTLDLVEPQDLQKYGLIPELVGRIPLACALSSLSIPALVQVLTEPRHSLLQQYTQLFALSSVELHVTSPALRAIAAAAATMGTGARGLRTVMERLLADAMFETPGTGVKHVLVTEAVAERKCAAWYFSRGEAARFQAMGRAEEEAWEEKLRREREQEEQEEAEEEEGGEGDNEFERRARNNSAGGAARTFEEYREKATAAGFV